LRRSVRATALLAIAALVVISFGGVQSANFSFADTSLLLGPYVDEVIYRIIPNQDQRVLALQAGTIEMDLSFFDPVYLPTLEADPDISIFRGVRNGYGHLTINCAKYPLNISGFRRAFAYAYDKTKIKQVILDGFGIDHDSLVPYPNGWCVEDQFDWNYYDAQPDIGNQILDDLGFTINATSGFRLAPDGTSFDIIIEGTYSGSLSIAGIGVEALLSLHISASSMYSDFNEYISRLDSHGDYDMVFYAENFYSNDVDWLAYEYWSEYADVPYQNPANFRNTTYDSWRDQLLYGTTYEDVYEAATEMQKILHYNVPRLVVYENTYPQAYRNDVFTGHVEDLVDYIAGPWTLRNIQRINGIPGGSVDIALGQESDSFNFFITEHSYSGEHIHRIINNLWPSLYRYGPYLTPYPDLAQNMIIETHSDNPSVPDGNLRFTVDIVQNATWTDGTPLTAEDVALSFIYYLESGVYGNPVATSLPNLVAAYAPAPYQVILEFQTESYWHFSDFAFTKVIPHHIFNDDTGIGYEDWNTWNPVFNVTHPHVTCGPFTFSEFELGEVYTIQRNPLFHYAAITETTSTTTSTTITTSPTTPVSSSTTSSSGTGQVPGQGISLSLAVSSVIGSFSSVVILYCLFLILRERRNMENI